MSDQRASTKAIWMHLLREGGRWSVREVAKALKSDAVLTSQNMMKMRANEYLVSFPRTRHKNGVAFGVTKECKVPRGFTVEELGKCGLVRLQPTTGEAQ
jgi:ribosomal protein L13E